MKRAMLAAALMFAFLLLTTKGKNRVETALIFGLFALAIYVPAATTWSCSCGDGVSDGGPPNDRRADVHRWPGAGELLHRAREGVRNGAGGRPWRRARAPA